MKTAFLASAIICMLSIAGFFMDATVQENRLLGNADAAVQQIQADAHENSLQISDVLIKFQSTAQVIQDAATENRKYYDKAAKDSAKTVDALRLLIDRTDRQINDGVLPQAQKAIGEFSAHSTETLDALTTSSKSLGNAADSLNRVVSDPHILETVDNVDRATRSLSQTSAHLDNISAMGELEVKRLTMPASLAKRIAFGTLSTAAKVGSAFAGFK